MTRFVKQVHSNMGGVHFSKYENCLGVAYPIYVEPSSDMRVEKLVGNILDSVNVPTPVAQAFHFFKGAADR
ncbi:unnamed protein product [Rotaria magnacalcarata]